MLNWTFIREVGPARWAVRYSTLQFNKRVLKRDSKLVLPTGKRIHLPRQSRTSTEIYVTNANMDWGAEALFARFADHRRDFLDIGSHIGYYAVYFSPLMRRVYAFEPDRRNFPALRRNSGAASNIEVVEMAVSSRNGVADFFSKQNSSMGGLESHGGEAVRVPVTTVDAFLAAHPGSDAALIKTDIEGHDLEALRGMERTVATCQPLILTECEMSAEFDDLRARWKYRVFAYLSEKGGHRPRLREFHLADRDRFRSKMLFLVPETLHSTFVNLT